MESQKLAGKPKVFEIGGAHKPHKVSITRIVLANSSAHRRFSLIVHWFVSSGHRFISWSWRMAASWSLWICKEHQKMQWRPWEFLLHVMMWWPPDSRNVHDISTWISTWTQDAGPFLLKAGNTYSAVLVVYYLDQLGVTFWCVYCNTYIYINIHWCPFSTQAYQSASRNSVFSELETWKTSKDRTWFDQSKTPQAIMYVHSMVCALLELPGA